MVEDVDEVGDAGAIDGIVSYALARIGQCGADLGVDLFGAVGDEDA